LILKKNGKVKIGFCTLLTRKWAVGGAGGGARELQSGRSAVKKVQKLFQLFR
jgi:hypothetical protein